MLILVWGEINENAKDFRKLKNTTSQKNTDWNSFYLDIASEKVKNVLKSRIKNIFYLGYDGLFLDNIDNYTSFGPQYHLQQNLVQFIYSIRNDFPNKTLVQNAGLEILNLLHTKIDYVLVESVFTEYNFAQQKYQLREAKFQIERLNLLKDKISKFNIKPLLLEYAVDPKMVKTIRKNSRKEKLPIIISEISLQNLPK